MGHGKGEWDGVGAVIKRALRTEQLVNPQRRLQNVEDCVHFFDATMAGQVPIRSAGMRLLLLPSHNLFLATTL